MDIPERGTIAVTLQLWKRAIVAGQVIDDKGEPVVGVTVVPLEEVWSSEVVRLVPPKSRVGVTDDRGEYRLSDLIPGTYVVGIAGAGTFHERGRLTGLDVDYGTAYAPGVKLAEQAQRITVEPGELRIGVNIRIPSIDPRYQLLQGRVLCEPPDLPWTVELLPAQSMSSVLSDLDIRRAVITNGSFQFAAVSPGPYVVRAIAFTQFTNLKTYGNIRMLMPDPPDPARTIETKPTYWAQSFAAVSVVEPAQVVLSCQRGRQIRGEVSWQGTIRRPDEAGVLRTSLTVRPLDGRSFIESASVKLDSAGRFATAGLPPGRYGLDVSVDRGTGWTFTSISVQGQTVDDGAIELNDDDVVNVVVTLTDRQTELSGLVRSTDLRPVASTVFVFPVDRKLRNAYASMPPRVVQVRPDDSGRYVVRGLPVGAYYVVATTADVPHRWQNPAFLESLEPGASRVRLGLGTNIEQNLIPRSAR